MTASAVTRPARVVLGAQQVVGAGIGVPDMDVGVRQPRDEGPRLPGEYVLGSVAGAVQPPDVARRALLVQRVQHGEHRCDADAGAQQHDRPCAVVEGELPARRGDLDPLTDVDGVAQVRAGGPVRVDLHRDPVAVAPCRCRQRVAAHERRHAVPWVQPERDELPREAWRERFVVVRFELERESGCALRVLRGEPQRAEPGPRPRRHHPGQPRVAATGRASAPLLQQRAQRLPPAGAERRDPQRPLEHLRVRAMVDVQQRVDRGDGHPLGSRRDLDDARRLPRPCLRRGRAGRSRGRPLPVSSAAIRGSCMRIPMR